ncbi:MAG: transglutaminase family protein [Thiohalocapsa sp. PB-PSB1]|jgi:transglutaminase-like putative cysteine protease|nr:MAG: hypothetical protein N838_15100 [Thiohalocapsa sp. PB-PSB1]QQO53296.1 MAG: transglutaminase family protein [Thiohalocapsa sp. PB-PSB1]
MRIHIQHKTRYDYDAPVQLGPHLLRLRPRLDGDCAEIEYALHIDPEPSARRDCLDAAGNRITRLWFDRETRHLQLHVHLLVETGDTDRLIPCLEPDALRLPLGYPATDAALLSPYLTAAGADPALTALAEKLSAAADGDAYRFLQQLNQYLYHNILREIRPSGMPQTPAQTLARGRGACRDQAVLFIGLCRAVGLAARFVSGYQDRSAMDTERRYLHAWPETYLPGFGWHGWDPTRGIEVTDGHIALAAAPHPTGTMPVEGCYFGDAGSRMGFELQVDSDADIRKQIDTTA